MSADNPSPKVLNADPLFAYFLSAAACFLFFTIVPLGICLAVIIYDGDPGGQLFLPLFLVGVLVLAGLITVVFTTGMFVANLLRRRSQVLPFTTPLGIFVLVTLFVKSFFESSTWPVALAIGSLLSVTFLIHWGLFIAVSRLPRLPKWLFGVKRPL